MSLETMLSRVVSWKMKTKVEKVVHSSILSLILILTIYGMPLFADDHNWITSAGGDWCGNSANWSPAELPADGDSAFFDLSGSTYTVSLSYFNCEPSLLLLETNDNVTFNYPVFSQGGPIEAETVTIGAASGDSGGISIPNYGAAMYALSSLNVGDSGTGALSITSGAALFVGPNTPASAYVGKEAGSNGTVTVSGYHQVMCLPPCGLRIKKSTLSMQGDCYIGYLGTGDLTVSDHGQVVCENAWLGWYDGTTNVGKGTAVVRGTDSIWIVYYDLNVGYGDSGGTYRSSGNLLTISEGGTVSTPSLKIWESNSVVMEDFSLLDGSVELEEAATYSGSKASLSGSGYITGDVDNDGLVQPGIINEDIMYIEGNYYQSGTGSTLKIEVAGTSEEDFIKDFNHLEVGGTATFDAGKIQIEIITPNTLSETQPNCICIVKSETNNGISVSGDLEDLFECTEGWTCTPVLQNNDTELKVWLSKTSPPEGTLWSWGDNEYGQLGNGTTGAYSYYPFITKCVPTVVAVASGEHHTIALQSDRTVIAWGRNNYGQLGDNGTNTDSNTPVDVYGLTGIIAIAAGANHSLALKDDGTVWAWGLNDNGQLGNGDENRADQKVPVQVLVNSTPTYLADIVAISGGGLHSLALSSSGTIYAWGDNNYGQLGNGTDFTDSPYATLVCQLSGIKAIDAGGYHSVALESDNTVWAWGWNYYGQLGDGEETSPNPPVPVQVLTYDEGSQTNITLADIKSVSAGEFHSAAITTTGHAYSWGNNEYGQLGNDDSPDESRVAVQVLTEDPEDPPNTIALTGVKEVSCGGYYSAVMMDDDTVMAWGNNLKGQLGDGTITQKDIAVDTAQLTRVSMISAGADHVMAIQEPAETIVNKRAVTWGYGNYGMLGNGDNVSYDYMVEVDGPALIAVSAGKWHCLGLKNDGTVWAWGRNAGCVLGTGDTSWTDQFTPVKTLCITGAVAIAAGGSHSLALKDDGTVWAWGYNNYGQVGDGSDTNRASPVQVLFPFGTPPIKAIAAAYTTSFAVDVDGYVWAWGRDYSGILGNGNCNSNPNQPTPQKVLLTNDCEGNTTDLTGIEIIVAEGNGNHVMALTTDGHVKAWGWNYYGQVGDNTTTFRDFPVDVYGSNDGGVTVVLLSELATTISQISAGGAQSAAVDNTGHVWTWGDNNYGQLCNNSTTDRHYAAKAHCDENGNYLTGISYVSSGYLHMMALTSTGTVFGWGRDLNGFGLGDNDNNSNNALLPVQVKTTDNEAIAHIVSVSAGEDHNVAVQTVQ